MLVTLLLETITQKRLKQGVKKTTFSLKSDSEPSLLNKDLDHGAVARCSGSLGRIFRVTATELHLSKSSGKGSVKVESFVSGNTFFIKRERFLFIIRKNINLALTDINGNLTNSM